METRPPTPSHYCPGLLDPRPGEAAERANARHLGPTTLGIEVTEPRLAARCGLGNIDPQHRPDGGARAAIEAALDWPLPPAGAQLMTIRPDADAYGTMAVLGLRAAGQPITPAMHARIGQIARADRFDRGPWPGLRALPARPEEVDEVGPGEAGLGALVGGISDRSLAPEAAVAAVRDWIVAGVVPGPWHDQAVAAQAELLAALRDGRLRLSAPDPGRIALAEGFVPGALRLGYRLAPVVVAVGEVPGGTSALPWRRITVGQWRAGHVDLVRALAMLAEAEPGWGGSPTIIGSPQGASCRTSPAQVVAVLRTCGA